MDIPFTSSNQQDFIELNKDLDVAIMAMKSGFKDLHVPASQREAYKIDKE